MIFTLDEVRLGKFGELVQGHTAKQLAGLGFGPRPDYRPNLASPRSLMPGDCLTQPPADSWGTEGT